MRVSDVVESATSVLKQWQYAQDKHFDNFLGLMNQEDGDEHWSFPTENKFKPLRDHTGGLIEARSSCAEGNISPECAEAMGIREALSWLKSKQMDDAIIETDCLVAVQAIRGSAILLSYFGRIIEECKQLLSELKNKGVSLKFVKRSANNVAHYVARYSCSIADRIWWMSNAHPEFLHVLKNDLQN